MSRLLPVCARACVCTSYFIEKLAGKCFFGAGKRALLSRVRARSIFACVFVRVCVHAFLSQVSPDILFMSSRMYACIHTHVNIHT
jgi:hypothetical protein